MSTMARCQAGRVTKTPRPPIACVDDALSHTARPLAFFETLLRGCHHDLLRRRDPSIAPLRLALLAKLMRAVIAWPLFRNATKLDPSSNSLSLEDSGSIRELDMPKRRPSRLRTWVEGDSRRERPVTAGAIVIIPIHFDTVVSLPRR